MRLSPLNLSGLLARDRGELQQSTPHRRKGSASEIVLWKCNHCGDTYDDEDEAVECCDDEEVGRRPQGNASCPCCLGPASDLRDATDCCLWKDIDALTRYRLADAVEGGATWADVLMGPQAH